MATCRFESLLGPISKLCRWLYPGWGVILSAGPVLQRGRQNCRWLAPRERSGGGPTPPGHPTVTPPPPISMLACPNARARASTGQRARSRAAWGSMQAGPWPARLASRGLPSGWVARLLFAVSLARVTARVVAGRKSHDGQHHLASASPTNVGSLARGPSAGALGSLSRAAIISGCLCRSSLRCGGSCQSSLLWRQAAR